MSGALDLIQADQAYNESLPQSQQPRAPAAQAGPQVRPDAPWQPAANAQPVSVGWIGQDSGAKGSGVSLGDYAKEAWASGQEMGVGILGAASWTARQLGTNPDIIQHIEQAKNAIADHAAGTVASMSPDAQRAAHASIFGGGTDANGEHVPTPGEVGWARYLGMTAASFVPDALAALLPGGIGARLGMRVAGEVGSAVSRVAATGGTFGTIQLGDAYNQFVKDVDQSKPEDWSNSPAMQQMLQSGMSFTDAKKSIVQQGMTQLGALQFGIGAVTGAGGASLLMRGPLGTAGHSLLTRLGLGAAEGALTMGAQSGGGEAAQQLANQGAGLQTEFDTSRLAHAIASGVMSGAVLGAAGGAMHAGAEQPRSGTPREETAEPGADTSMVAPDTQAALNTQLELNLTQAGPGQIPGSPQGELFRSVDQAQPTQPAAASAAVQPTAPPAGTPPAPQAATASPTAAAGPQPNPPGRAPGLRPSSQFTRQQLIDSLSTMPGQDPTLLRRMTKGDLATRYDQAAAQAQPSAQPNLSEPTTTVVQPAPNPAEPVAVQPRPAEGAEPLATAEPVTPAQPATPVDEAAAQAEEPTPAQAEAGNYQKGHINIGGLDVSIETPQGGVRRGTGPDGTPWEATMPAHYGYIRRTEGADGDHLDVTLGPQAHQAEQHPVYVIDQKDPATGKFDEHKAFIGFATPADAIQAYDGSFSDGSGPSRRGALTQMPFDQFKEWAQNGDTTKPLAYKPTVSEQLKARRAALKAKMAAPGAPQRGRVATVESETPTPEVEPRTREQAVQTVHDAVQGAKATIVPIKGIEVDRVMNTVMRELEARLAGAKTEGDVQEAVARWGRSSAQPIPGSRTRRVEVADRVMQMLTGKTVDEFSGRAQRIAREVSREPRPPAVFENEGTARQADLEAAHAREQDQARETATTVGENSEGTTQAIEGAETPMPQKIVDRLPWWLDRVLNGHMTVQEADAAYGRQKPGAGRPRQYKTFADYLDGRIRDAEDPATAESLREQLSRVSTKQGQAKSAESVQLERLLDQTGKEFADKLRDLKAELDPVGEAVAEQQPRRAADVLRERLAAHRATKGEGHALPDFNRGDRYIASSRDPRVNRVVSELLTRDTEDEQARPLSEYLNAIAEDRLVAEELPAYRMLARRMSSIAPNIQVMPASEALRRYKVMPQSTANGAWVQPTASRPALIYLDPTRGGNIETILHEGMHAITANYIDRIAGRTVTHWDDIDAVSHPDLAALRAIKDELQDALESRVDSDELTNAEIERHIYALGDPHELHTMLMTDPKLQRLAASHIPSSQFRLRMQQLGYGRQAARSIWNAFTIFVKRALGLSVRDSVSDALFDHILRPLQDITDRAAEYNRRSVDPVLDAASRALPDFRDTARTAVDRIDPAGMGDRVRRALLAATTSDGIVQRYRDLFETSDGNALVRWRAANEAVAARGAKFHNGYADKVAELLAQFNGPYRDDLARLLVDATTADVRLGRNLPADANKHLTTQESQTTRKALQVRYDALPAAAKDAYDASHTLQDKMYAEERAARLNGMLKGLLPDATGEQLKQLREVSTSRTRLMQFLGDPDNSQLAGSFGTAWATHRSLVRGIAAIHNMGFVNGDYFPLRRFGDYVLRYGSKENGDYGVEMFERRSEAEVRRSELLKQNVDNVSPVLDKRTSQLRDTISHPAINEIATAMEQRGYDEAAVDSMRDLLASVVLQHATRSERARTQLRRQRVLGASTDIEQIVARDFLAAASRVGYLEHGSDRTNALADMQRRVDELARTGGAGEQIKASAVLHEAQQRVPTGDDANSIISKVLRKASPFGYIQSLMSPSHMLTSTFEAHSNSIPLMGARHGTARATLALGKALRDVTPVLAGKGLRHTVMAMGEGLKAADWNLSTVARDRLIARGANREHMIYLTNLLNNAGLIDHTMVRELQRIARPGADVTRGWWGKFLDLNMAGAHAVDVINKMAIAKAGFDLEFAKTKDYKAAAQYAEQLVRQAMPNYNLANKPRIATAQGPLKSLAAPIMQFKMYGLHMYSMMANLLHASLHSASRAERREAALALSGIIATHVALTGVFSVLGDPLRFLGGAYDWVTGAAKPHDYQNDVRRVISDMFGPELGEIIARGLPHAVGVDMHRRVGLNNLLELPEIQSFDRQGYLSALASAFTGAAGEDATTMVGGFSKMLNGDIEGGLKDMVPRVIRDMVKASDLAQRGVTDSQGRTILPPNKLTDGDIVYQAAGFQPSRVTEFREGRFATMEARDEIQAERTQLISAWLSAAPDDRAMAKERIDEFNAANPGAKITISQLFQARQTQRRGDQIRSRTAFGLRLPKDRAAMLSEAGRFANVQ